MTKRVTSLMVAALLTSGLLLGCLGGPVVTGSGNLKTEEMRFSEEFSQVEVSSAFEVEIVQADSYTISITADDNLFEYIQLSKSGSTLKISLKKAQYINTTIKAKITISQLRLLELSGATRGTISGFVSTEKVDIKVRGASSVKLADMSASDVKFHVDGASKVTGNIIANNVRFDIDGASSIELEGSATDIVVKADSASHVELTGFRVDNADVRFSGASSGTVNLVGRLDIKLTGASKLYYIGDPTIGDITVSDTSTLSKK